MDIDRLLISPFFKKEKGILIGYILIETITDASILFSGWFDHRTAQFDKFRSLVRSADE
jgi:hypothetical protein